MRGKVAIIGSGTIGRAWAICFARGGYETVLYDSQPGATEAALSFVERMLPELAERGLAGTDDIKVVRTRISAADDLGEALRGAVHVQENTPEDLASKIDVFRKLDAAADAEATIASSTSALLPSSFTADLAGRWRCLVAHPVNPPYLLPAVEIVPAPWTDPGAVERVRTLMTTIGQAPLTMAREVEGFIVNRLQGALLQEAYRLVSDGYATIHDVDVAVRDGLGLRWSFMGPFETIDLNAPAGISQYAERYEPLYRDLARSHKTVVSWQGELGARIEAERTVTLPRDRLAERQAWRDRRLMALVGQRREASRQIGD